MSGTFTGISGTHLKQFIQRIETLEEDKVSIISDIREVMAEARNEGFDTKAIREIIKIRKMDANDRSEQKQILATYLNALGMDNE